MRGCSCGEILRADDRYCRSCGKAAIDPVKGRSRPLLALGAVVAVALAWGLFRGGDAASLVDETIDRTEQNFEPVADGRLGPLDPDDFPAPDPDVVPEEDSDDRDTRPRVEAKQGEPLVGEETGLGLVVGGPDSADSLQIVSLDSGKVNDLPEVVGWPVGIVGTNVILQTDSALVALDLVAPERGVEMVAEFGTGELAWAWVDRDVIWVMASGPDQGLPTRALGYGVDGRQVDVLEVQSGIFSFLWPHVPDLRVSHGGGIYRRSDGGVELLSDGVLLAVGERLALVYRCDDQMRCEASWHDRDSWEQRPFGQPPGDPLLSLTNLMGDDRWVVSSSIYDGITTVAAVSTGEIVDEFEISLDGRPEYGMAISPEGRWLLGPSTGDDKIIDLEGGTVWLTNLVFPSNLGRLFVDLTDTAFED